MVFVLPIPCKFFSDGPGCDFFFLFLVFIVLIMVSVLSYSLEIFTSAIPNITLLHSLLSGIISMHILDFPISYMALSFSPIFSVFLSLYMHLFNFFYF
jgi:hypothetical protein